MQKKLQKLFPFNMSSGDDTLLNSGSGSSIIAMGHKKRPREKPEPWTTIPGPAWRLPLLDCSTQNASAVHSDQQQGANRYLISRMVGSCIPARKVDVHSAQGNREFVGSLPVSYLCSMTKIFDAMMETGMEESSTGRIFLPGSPESVEIFLHFILAGYPVREELENRMECYQCADARELWLMADMFDLGGILEWLMQHAIDATTVLPVLTFALAHGQKKLEDKCFECEWEIQDFDRETLAGVSSEAMYKMLDHLKGDCEDAEHLFEGWKRIFPLIEMWIDANLECNPNAKRDASLNFLEPFGLHELPICCRQRAAEIMGVDPGGMLIHALYRKGMHCKVSPVHPEDDVMWVALELQREIGVPHVSKVQIWHEGRMLDHSATFDSYGILVPGCIIYVELLE